MQQFFEALTDFINDHWIKFLTGLLLMAVGWYVGKRRARAQWVKREFLHRLNVSLNVIQEGQPLRIRTLIEKTCAEIFLNATAEEAVTAAARRTTESNPLLPLPKEDYWQYLNAVLNEVAEKFADGELKRDMGMPVTTRRYVLCLTCECAGAMRTRKVRAMILQKSVLENLPAQPPAFEHPTHITRWETLQALARELQKSPHQFLEIEISQ